MTSWQHSLQEPISNFIRWVVFRTVYCFLLTEISNLERIYHSSVVIGDNAFVWGGGHKDIPIVHDSPEKRQFTSIVETFNMLTGKWEKQQTTGSPPNGTLFQ